MKLLLFTVVAFPVVAGAVALMSAQQLLAKCAPHTLRSPRFRITHSIMLRRNARLRREYLYRKSLEGKEREDYERKRRIQEALQSGQPVPTDLKAVAKDVISDAQFDDVDTAGPPVSIDDEYARAGEVEPKVLITTARDPSSRLQQFAKELRLLIPNSQRINRGGTIIKELVTSSRSSGVTDLIILHEHRGEPGIFSFFLSSIFSRFNFLQME